MRRFSKFILPWLIAFALPIQGMAAVTAALCGPMHQGMAADGQASELSVQHDAHAGDPHKMHHHDHGSSKMKHDLPNEKVSCSACAACCTGSAVSASEYHVPDLISVSLSPLSLEAAPLSGVVSDGLERPPRTLLV
jgi:hypothetical protein